MQLKASITQLTLVISSGLFLGFVLFVYHAFGIDQGMSFSGHTFIERVTLFSCNVCLVFAINELVLKPRLALDASLKSVLWVLWEIFSAATATHVLFNYFWNWTESFWGSYFLLLGEMTSVLVVPFGLYFLLYVKAEDNYVKVVYRSKGQEKSFLLRRKLSEVEKLSPSLLRVHRSYLINVNNVMKIEQKTKSGRIHFDTGSSIPSSAKYQFSISQLTGHPV